MKKSKVIQSITMYEKPMELLIAMLPEMNLKKEDIIVIRSPYKLIGKSTYINLEQGEKEFTYEGSLFKGDHCITRDCQYDMGLPAINLLIEKKFNFNAEFIIYMCYFFIKDSSGKLINLSKIIEEKHGHGEFEMGEIYAGSYYKIEILNYRRIREFQKFVKLNKILSHRMVTAWRI